MCSVMAGGLNDAGRGLNIVIVNPRTKDVIRVGHFDTFGSGSLSHVSMFFSQCICVSVWISIRVFNRNDFHYLINDEIWRLIID